jgi:hypothetical protein
MAIYKTLLTYRIPDERYGQADVLGKTSTIQYEGPEKLILWLTKDGNNLEEAWDADDMTERPIPGDMYQVELDAKAGDKECLIAGMIGPSTETYHPFGNLKRYEIKTGPDDVPNSSIKDPTYPSHVFDRNDIQENMYDPETKQFKNLRYHDNTSNMDNLDDDRIRHKRNMLLVASDHRVAASDIPDDIKKDWTDYRKKLRDLPADWKECPNELIEWPKDPDKAKGAAEMEASGQPKPLIDHYVKIVDRTAEDKKAIEQMWPIAGVDENAP